MVEAGTNNNAIDVTLRRHKYGIKLDVRVWPEVEEFFQHWSGNVAERPQFGRLWKSMDSAAPLNLWAQGATAIGLSATQPYSLSHTGGAVFEEHGYVNISYIRLVGASAPEGVSFVIEMPIGRTELTRLAQRISEASHQFYAEYLQPVNLKAFVGVHLLPSAAQPDRADAAQKAA